MTIPELEIFDKQFKEALSPTVFMTLKDQDDANKNKNIKVSIGGGAQTCPINCSDDYNGCLNATTSNTPSGVSFACTVGNAFCVGACSFQLIRTPINSAPKAQAIKVEATIEKIYCRSVDDGKKRQYGRSVWKYSGSYGQICYDGDAERHPPVEVKGNGFWKLEPQDYIKLRNGQTKRINKKVSWKYSLPPSCGSLEGQTVVILPFRLG
jgi:hypothetical protein